MSFNLLKRVPGQEWIYVVRSVSRGEVEQAFLDELDKPVLGFKLRLPGEFNERLVPGRSMQLVLFYLPDEMFTGSLWVDIGTGKGTTYYLEGVNDAD